MTELGWLLDRAGDRMFGAGRTMHGLMREHLRTYQERDARMREPLPSIDRKADAERRARFSAMEDAGTLMQSIMAADLADLTALVADGNIAALSHDAWREAQKQFLVLNTVARTGMQADFAGKPTLENPLPDGPDVEGARRQAEAVLDSHDADRQVIDIHRRVIQDYAGFLGHVFGIAPGQAFERMAA
ncbi:hypothetical protein [Qipengyuania sp.]|uniref:hypothetical protein n=1 Tax=Qipengyuania sp. TaxID=2004515 RepID=UPI0037352A3B